MIDTATDDDLIDRATKAYYKRSEIVPDHPSLALCQVVKKQKTRYVVLANSYRTLAVYKVKPNGKLEGLLALDWPKGVK